MTSAIIRSNRNFSSLSGSSAESASPSAWFRLAVATLRTYRVVMTPILGPTCRFAPSCSHYAEEALGRHGFVAGIRLTLARILRCHPWNAGGWDPVPGDRDG